MLAAPSAMGLQQYGADYAMGVPSAVCAPSSGLTVLCCGYMRYTALCRILQAVHSQHNIDQNKKKKSVRGLLWLPTQARAQNVAQQPAAHQQEQQEQGQQQQQQQQLYMGRRVNGEARFVKRDGNACLNIRDIATLPPDQIPAVFSRTAHAPRKLPPLKRGVIIPR